MNKTVKQVADIITSLGMVIFVLLMTVTAMIFLGHGLYYQVFFKIMPPWQAQLASWVLSFGVETTVLVITCNVRYFSSKRLPVFFAICSGFIVLFFIQAFDTTQPGIDMAIRWFIGALIVGIAYVYSELFVKKYADSQSKNDLAEEMNLIKGQNEQLNKQQLIDKAELTKAKSDLEKLIDYVAELETFKQREIEKLTCVHCKGVFDTIFRLNGHRSICEMNPKQGQRESIYEAVV